MGRAFRDGAVTGGAFVTGIFEGTRLDFTVFEAGFTFDAEVGGSRNRSSPSSDKGTKETEAAYLGRLD